MCYDFSAHLLVWETLEIGRTTQIPNFGTVRFVFITALSLRLVTLRKVPLRQHAVLFKKRRRRVSVLFRVRGGAGQVG